MMAMQRDDEPNSLAWAYRNKVTCRPNVDGFSVAGVFDDFGSDVPERTGERSELFAGAVEEFGLLQKYKPLGFPLAHSICLLTTYFGSLRVFALLLTLRRRPGHC